MKLVAADDVVSRYLKNTMFLSKPTDVFMAFIKEYWRKAHPSYAVN